MPQNCAKCKKELELVSQGHPLRRRDDWTVQYDNALAIEFIGGYGMFDDPYMKSSKELIEILCHDCAHQFLADNPWITSISQTHGHMHEGTDFGRKGHGHEFPVYQDAQGREHQEF